MSHGKGAYIWDTEGRRYLDFSAGIAVNALGHSDMGVANVSTTGSMRGYPNMHSVRLIGYGLRGEHTAARE